MVEDNRCIGKTEEECIYLIKKCRKVLYHCDGLDDLVNVELLKYGVGGGADLHDLSVVRGGVVHIIDMNQKRHYDLFSKRVYG